MSGGPVLAIVVSPRPWAHELHRFVADHGGAHVRLRVVDAREAEHEPYDVLVCEDLTSFLSARLVDRLHAQGKRVLGVHDTAEPHGATVLHDLGADDVTTATTPTAELLARARGLAEGRDVAAAVPVAESDRSTRSLPPPTALAGAAVPGVPAAPKWLAPRAHVLAVGGPSGAPGATEVALALAVAAATAGERVVLVDGDEVAPSLAQRLAARPHPNLRSALDVVRTARAHVASSLQAVPAVPGLRLLGGLPSVQAWADARPGDVVEVVRALGDDADRVVVNVGPRLDELGGRRRGHGRHGQTVSLLGAADDLVAVGLPTPVGVGRLLDWVATARNLVDGRVDVAVNRCPRRGFVASEVVREVRRSWDPAVLALLPEDARVARAAWRGEVDGSRAWWRAVGELAVGVLQAVPTDDDTGGATGDVGPAAALVERGAA